MILVCYGTRPEIIKLSPVIAELGRRGMALKTVFTGQHMDLYEDVKHLVPPPDYSLAIMQHDQSLNGIMTSLGQKFPALLEENAVDLVIVQGDTSSAFLIGLMAFYHKVKVGHVEAGLRTHNRYSPFPEEMNRTLLGRLTTYNWAPTRRAYEALRAEGAPGVHLTGNTIVDVCLDFNLPVTYEDRILVTLHRRENFGGNMVSLFTQLNGLALEHPHYRFIFPMHPNPNVRMHRDRLAAPNIEVRPPLKYDAFIREISACRFIITDSGGVQEEACSFRKKVLVCRDTTERPEGVEAGMARVIGTRLTENFGWADGDPRWQGPNPYGDGRAAQRIADTIAERVPGI